MKDYLSDFFEHVMLSLAAVAMFVLAYGASFAVLYNLLSFVLSKLGVSNKIVMGVSLVVVSVVSLWVCHGMKDMETRSENMAEPMFCISLLLFALGIFVCFYNGRLGYGAEEIKNIKSESYFAGYDAGYEAAYDSAQRRSPSVEYESQIVSITNEDLTYWVEEVLSDLSAIEDAANDYYKIYDVDTSDIVDRVEDARRYLSRLCDLGKPTETVTIERWRWDEIIGNVKSLQDELYDVWDSGYIQVDDVDGYLSNITWPDYID